MQNNTLNMNRRSLLTKAAIGVPAMGVVGALSWANPTSTPEASAIAVDGIWGPDTTRSLQHYLKMPMDGIVSGQDPRWRAGNTHLGDGWDWSGGGSLLIAAIQFRLGVTLDGIFGPQTSRAWHLRVTPSHVSDHFDNQSIVATIQAHLNLGNNPFGKRKK